VTGLLLLAVIAPVALLIIVAWIIRSAMRDPGRDPFKQILGK
jgi:hypothetical protein